MVKIVKFGGSSLADAHQFKKVGDIIKSDPDRRFVVPSAPGKRFKDDIKVTDLLYKAYNKSLNVLLIQSKIVIKVLLMNLIYLSILLQNLKLLRKISKIKSVKNMPQVVGNI